jgi:SAM-dependent methyltransferase
VKTGRLPDGCRSNIDAKTVQSFGDEWSRFNQSQLGESELQEIFDQYFDVFPWEQLPDDAIGFDVGCGSGRWAKVVAPRVGTLHCIDASPDALKVAKDNLTLEPNCVFHLGSVDSIPLDDSSMDFGYCLGVLHHLPNPLGGLKSSVEKLRRGAPFLIYIYYAFDNRPWWFRGLWKISDFLRRGLSGFPSRLKAWISAVIALSIYLPLARASLLLEKLGLDVESIPLSYYRRRSFYTMRTDALDRFGTPLEKRFTASEIRQMMGAAGLEKITFSDSPPYWHAIGYRVSDGYAMPYRSRSQGSS